MAGMDCEETIMSINELIGTSSHHAFEAGKRSERARSIRLARFLSEPLETGKGESFEIVFLADLIDYLNDEDEK